MKSLANQVDNEGDNCSKVGRTNTCRGAEDVEQYGGQVGDPERVRDSLFFAAMLGSDQT